MNLTRRSSPLWFVLLLSPTLALAQASEEKAAGLTRREPARYSLEVDLGASYKQSMPLGGLPSGPPMFLGVTASYWADESYGLDLLGAYLADTDRLALFAGPRFRTAHRPFSLSAGAKVGLLSGRPSGVRLALSSSVGADLLLAKRVLLGLGYSVDVPIQGDSPGHRVSMRLGLSL